MSFRQVCQVVICLAGTMSGGVAFGQAAGKGGDPCPDNVRAENPVISELPVDKERVACIEIIRIKRPVVPQDTFRAPTEGHPTPAELEQIQANKGLQETYRSDPVATLRLLHWINREIQQFHQRQ